MAATTDNKKGTGKHPDNAVSTAGDFFSLVEINAAEADQYPDIFDRIRHRELGGVILNKVFDEAVLLNVVKKLERHDPPFLKTWFPEEFNSWFYGRNLNLANPDLSGYFAEAAIFNRQLEKLFPPGSGISNYLADIMSQMDGGRKFLAPPGPGSGENYMFATVRGHMQGGFIPPHIDNEYMLRRSYHHLRNITEANIISFVLVLSAPEAGGALEIFDYCREFSDTSDYTEQQNPAAPDPTPPASVKLHLPAGSMIIFDSGRYLHALSPITGPAMRYTLCSFMTLSRQHDVMYCWG